MTPIERLIAVIAYLMRQPAYLEIGSRQHRVLMSLLRHMNVATRLSWPSEKLIAKEVYQVEEPHGREREKVGLALDELAARGLIGRTSLDGLPAWLVAPELVEGPATTAVAGDGCHRDGGKGDATAAGRGCHPGGGDPATTAVARTIENAQKNKENESVAAAPLTPAAPAQKIASKKRITRTRKTELAPASKEAVEVAEYLRDAILEHQPTHRCGLNGEHEKWAIDIDLAIRIDKRTAEGLKAAIDFAHRNEADTFWRANLQSGKKLREKYDRLEGQAARARPPQCRGKDLEEWAHGT